MEAVLDVLPMIVFRHLGAMDKLKKLEKEDRKFGIFDNDWMPTKS